MIFEIKLNISVASNVRHVFMVNTVKAYPSAFSVRELSLPLQPPTCALAPDSAAVCLARLTNPFSAPLLHRSEPCDDVVAFPSGLILLTYLTPP